MLVASLSQFYLTVLIVVLGMIVLCSQINAATKLLIVLTGAVLCLSIEQPQWFVNFMAKLQILIFG